MMARKDRVKPTHYPALLFHAVRSVQLVSSIIVAAIMAYFLHELAQDRYRLPWTFILLLVVSLLTILFLSATIVLHCFYGLNPLLNTLLNTGLAVLWSVAFALLAWWSSGTLRHVCNRDTWDDEMGVSICRIYKALFSFALFGLVATILALVLDVHVQRDSTRRGRFTIVHPGEVHARSDNGMKMKESNPNPTAKGRKRSTGQGYEIPEEQFSYEQETGYEGAAGQVGRRSVEDRI